MKGITPSERPYLTPGFIGEHEAKRMLANESLIALVAGLIRRGLLTMGNVFACENRCGRCREFVVTERGRLAALCFDAEQRLHTAGRLAS